jgi:hypothetical protein
MASGHVNRTQRPNTWLHRPSLRREDSPCQLGAVHTWPKAADRVFTTDCRFRGEADIDRFWRALDMLRLTHNRHHGLDRHTRLLAINSIGNRID